MTDRPRPVVTISDGDADSAQIAEFEHDRRDLLRRGIAAGGAAVAASSIPLLLMVRNAFAARAGDIEFLDRATTLERVAVLAYDHMAGSGLLSPRLVGLAKQFAAHEHEHADSLAAALRGYREPVPKAPSGVADIDAVLKGIGDVKSQTDALNFMIELEQSTVAAYYDAQRDLVDAKLLQLTASIMANEGQHLVLLRQAARKPPVPKALETGGSG